MKKCFAIFLFIGFSFCVTAQKNLIDKVFDKEQAGTMYKIIDFYDAFILSKIDTALPIDKAYYLLLENNQSIFRDSGDLAPLIPDDEHRMTFIRSLNIEHLKEIFADSVRAYHYSKGKLTYYLPDYFSTNLRGKYMEFVKKLGKRKRFYKSLYQDTMLCGDIVTPISQYATTHEYKHINFKSKDERLFFIVIFLFSNPGVFVERE